MGTSNFLSYGKLFPSLEVPAFSFGGVVFLR